MSHARAKDVAKAFLRDYRDPEIDKRLCFDVWSDRGGLGTMEKLAVWRMVKHLTRQQAGLKARGSCAGRESGGVRARSRG